MSHRLLVAIGAMLVAGCSTSNNTYVESKCGAGTVLVDGVCEAAGNDAAVGGSDSSGASDSSISEPDVEVGSSDGASEGGEVTGDASSTSDPCPSSSIIVNCSKTCGGPTANCSQAQCPIGSPSVVMPLEIPSLPAIVRTPDRPGRSLYCGCELVSSGSVYSMLIGMDFGTAKRVKVTVGPGWRLPALTDSRAWCGVASDTRRCRIYSGSGTILVTTDDPDAPSRNVQIVETTVGDTCP